MVVNRCFWAFIEVFGFYGSVKFKDILSVLGGFFVVNSVEKDCGFFRTSIFPG
jgi:hypothetical protein